MKRVTLRANNYVKALMWLVTSKTTVVKPRKEGTQKVKKILCRTLGILTFKRRQRNQKRTGVKENQRTVVFHTRLGGLMFSNEGRSY